MNLTPLRYDDLDPITVPVTLKDGEYLLMEATADAAIKYRNAGLSAARMVDGKLQMFEGLADVEVILVGHCLYRKNGRGGPVTDRQGNAKPVGEEFARTLNSRVLKALYARAREISPALEEKPPTLEDVDAQIARLQEHRDQLVKETTGPKDSHESGPGSST